MRMEAGSIAKDEKDRESYGAGKPREFPGIPGHVVGQCFVVTSSVLRWCSQMPCVDTDVRGKEQNKEEFSSLGFSAKGSNWKHSTSGALSVCLLKLELSAEKLWSVVSL